MNFIILHELFVKIFEVKISGRLHDVQCAHSHDNLPFTYFNLFWLICYFC